MLDTGSKPLISAVNFAEICTVLGHEAGLISTIGRPENLRDLLTIEPPDPPIAQAAGFLKYAYRMSMADSFAAATAMAHDAVLWTGDPELLCSYRLWKVLDLRPQPHPAPAALRARAECGRAEAASIVAGAFGRARGSDPLGLDW